MVERGGVVAATTLRRVARHAMVEEQHDGPSGDGADERAGGAQRG